MITVENLLMAYVIAYDAWLDPETERENPTPEYAELIRRVVSAENAGLQERIENQRRKLEHAQTPEYVAALEAENAELKREAADTIESLRDRLQDAEDARYDAGFENGVKACLQQLDGLIHEGADIDEIQGWIDRQWEEEVV